MRAKKIWYLAHPVNPDAEHTFEDNLEHTREMLRMCHEFNFYAVAPWYGMVEAYKDFRHTPAYEKFRALGLEMDEENVRAYGRIILTGHVLSEGMQREYNALKEIYPVSIGRNRVIDLVGMTNDEARAYLKSAANG